jgi:uncharacterized protein YbbK (DUF523 family)
MVDQVRDPGDGHPEHAGSVTGPGSSGSASDDPAGTDPAGTDPASDDPAGADPARRPAILVSACLLGVACTHLGQAKWSPAVAGLAEGARLIPVCPEVAGGLPTPRPAAEIGSDGVVRTASGEDVTRFYRRGAEHAVTLARTASVARAVLKARSPSCGCHQIYDGTHSGVLVGGRGVTAAALVEAGYEVLSEEDLEQEGR